LRKQNEDGVTPRKADDGIENIGRDRGIWMTGSRNVETDRESLRLLGVARGRFVESAGSPGTLSGKDKEARKEG
jgi:hypothetical protein